MPESVEIAFEERRALDGPIERDQRLEQIGHGFKLSEIREALDILGNTKFALTITDGAASCTWPMAPCSPPPA